MSGVEIALAAIALAVTVVSSVTVITQVIDEHQSAKVSKGTYKAVQDFNQANLLAIESEDRQDGGTTKKLSSKSKDLLKKIRDLVKMKNDFDARVKKAGASSTSDGEIKKEAKVLVKAAKEIQQMAESIISKIFGNRLKGTEDGEDLLSRVPPSPENPRHFCVGAILCQQGRITVQDLLDQNIPQHVVPAKGFVCRYCSLAVGNARTLHVSSEGEVLTSQDLLPASHLVACHSLADPRCLYRCVICSRKQADVDFYNASGLERHMQREHPDEPLLLKEEAGTQVLESDVNALLETVSLLDQDTTLNEDSLDSISSTLQPSPSVSQTFNSLDDEEKMDVLVDKYNSETFGSTQRSASAEAAGLGLNRYANYAPPPQTQESLRAELPTSGPPSVPFVPDYRPPLPPQPPQSQVSPRQNTYSSPNGPVDNGGFQRNTAGVPYGTQPALPGRPSAGRDRNGQPRY